MIETLNELWNKSLDGCAPLAHTFRDKFSDRWVRLHSLPESKRYPDLETEYQEVLYRHNKILNELSNKEEMLILIATEYSEKKEHDKLEKELDELMTDNIYWNSCLMEEPEDDDDDVSFCHQYIQEVRWEPSVFDDVLRLVANDEVANIMIFSSSTGWLYHPYDGGADVILKDSDARNSIKDRYAKWLSVRPDGL